MVQAKDSVALETHRSWHYAKGYECLDSYGIWFGLICHGILILHILEWRSKLLSVLERIKGSSGKCRIGDMIYFCIMPLNYVRCQYVREMLNWNLPCLHHHSLFAFVALGSHSYFISGGEGLKIWWGLGSRVSLCTFLKNWIHHICIKM